LQYITYLYISRKRTIQLGGKHYYSILTEFGIPRKLIGLIKMCLNETYSTVDIREKKSF
jgi:hypothetical protein